MTEVRKLTLWTLALVAMTWPLSAATPKRKASKRHTNAMVTPSRKAPKYKAPKYSASKPKSSKPKRHARSYQQAPTPERYKEIQQALVDKGYLRAEPNGEWNGDSTAALKRFQADQNLTPDGKLSSLSLIALGLGPKRLTAQVHPPVDVEAPKAELPK